MKASKKIKWLLSRITKASIRKITALGWMSYTLLPTPSHGFPEMIRHNYVNCTSCHVSPSGGGVLNEYGRALSKEVLSFSAAEGEENFLWFKKSNDKLFLGGDVRAIQIFQETPTRKDARFRWMEADIEGALVVDKFTFDATFGRIWKTVDDVGFGSRRYYISYQIDEEFRVRGGRFLPAFGINSPNHYDLVRTVTGLGKNGETHNLEASYLGEKWNVYFTLLQMPGEVFDKNREVAEVIQGSYIFYDKYKVGVSLWNGRADNFERKMIALHGILGFTTQFYSTVESQYVSIKNSGADETPQYVHTIKLAYEFWQGIHFYIKNEFQKPDTRATDDVVVDAIGTYLYPRPHFEIQGEYQKIKQLGNGSRFDDLAYILMHFYF